MRKPLCAAALLLGMVSLSWVSPPHVPIAYAQEPQPAVSVTLPAEVKVDIGRLAAVKIEYVGDDVKWDVPSGLDVFREYDPDPRVIRLRVIGASAGEYRILAVAAKGGKLSDFAACKVIVGTPTPTPPAPPQPPTPPQPPSPPPDPAPIKEPGLRVLIVYESADMAKYPSGQVATIYSQELYDLLAANCVAGVDGKTKEWRIWDQNVDVSKESPIWSGAMKRARKSLPWIVVSNGTTGFEGPLPATLAETTTLVRKYIPPSRSMTDTQQQYLFALEKLNLN